MQSGDYIREKGDHDVYLRVCDTHAQEDRIHLVLIAAFFSNLHLLLALFKLFTCRYFFLHVLLCIVFVNFHIQFIRLKYQPFSTAPIPHNFSPKLLVLSKA